MAKTGTWSKLSAAAAVAGLTLSPLAAEAAVTAKKPVSVPITLPLSYAPMAGPAWTVADETAHNHRYRYRRGGIDGGDVVAGVLILGTVAAIATAIDKDSKNSRRDRTDGRQYPYGDRDYRYRDRDSDDRYGDERYGDRRGGSSDGWDAREADRAVEACTAEARRNGRVDEVYEVNRRDGEWRVRGDYDNGRGFSCTVDRNGRAYVGQDDHAENRVGGPDFAEDEPQARVLGEADGADDGRYATGRTGDFEDKRGR